MRARNRNQAEQYRGGKIIPPKGKSREMRNRRWAWIYERRLLNEPSPERGNKEG